ncbi:glycosyltransferase family 4 protein [Luminiphilus sp.]|nr:glycosyltransferase family 4 protein [Luminiphilus sp.]
MNISRRKLKPSVLIVVESWIGKGGVQTFSLNIKKMLNEGGIQSGIFVYGKSDSKEALENHFRYLPGMYGLFRVLLEIFLKRPSHIVLNQPKSLVLAPILSIFFNVDYVVHIDGDRFLKGRHRSIYFNVLTRYMRGYVYVMSKENMRKLEIKYKIPGQKLKFVRPPLFFEDLDRVPDPGDREFDIIFYGRLAAQKDPLKFIDICDSVVSEIGSLRVCIVGDGPLSKAVTSRLEHAVFECKKISFVEQDEGFRLLREAKLFCLTSTHEGLGFTLIESAFNGTVPICGPIASGPKELISELGAAVPSLDVADYKDTIVALLRDMDKLRSLQQRAVSAAREYKSERVVDQYLFAGGDAQ